MRGSSSVRLSLCCAQVLIGAVALSTASAVEMDRDRRMLASGFPAAGFVRCGTGSGSAQLVGSRRVIVTAAHVLYGHNGLRSSACHFQIMAGGAIQSHQIDMSSVMSGTSAPYATSAVHDWAAARLVGPVESVRPLAFASASIGLPVRLVSARTLASSGAVSIEQCWVRSLRNAREGNEMMIDCSAQSGDSGAALLGPDGRLVGLYVGFRSAAPGLRQPFSAHHYNFAIIPPPALRQAVSTLAR